MDRYLKPSEAVAVRLIGGLGNQLFQYAAGRATSLRLNCPLVLDLRELEKGTAITSRSYMLHVFRTAGIVANTGTQDGWLEYQQPAYCYDEAFAEIGRGTRLNGYFQSELFFAPYGRKLREELRLAIPPSLAFVELATRIRKALYPVSIHLRRGDFVNVSVSRDFHGTCAPSYYAKAMRILDGLSDKRPDYFVFSDDRAEAVNLFADIANVSIAATPVDKPWEDMVLMSMCRDHILANSSFSWWASWLNDSERKTIVAPRRWVSASALRLLNTADLYPEGSIII